MVQVLFVCTGNICRSPQAEGVFRAMVEQAQLGEHITCDSCGTDDYHVGHYPDNRAIQVAEARGYDIGDLEARALHDKDYERFDYLIAMAHNHFNLMMKKAPEPHRHKIFMFMEFASESDDIGSVPDPYYDNMDGFEQVMDLIEQGCKGLLEHIKVNDLNLATTN